MSHKSPMETPAQDAGSPHERRQKQQDDASQHGAAMTKPATPTAATNTMSFNKSPPDRSQGRASRDRDQAIEADRRSREARDRQPQDMADSRGSKRDR